jgi:sialidase-1
VARLAPLPAKLQLAGGFTVSFWFRTTAVDSVGADAFNLAGGYVVRLKSGTIELVKHATNTSGMMNEVCLSTLTSHLDGKWHHAAGINDATGMSFYLDGTRLCTKPSTAVPIYAPTELSVGRNSAGATTLDFGGNLDDLRVYSRALSPAEITALAMGED